MKQTLFLILMAVTAFAWTSCKEDDPEVIKSKTELLTAHSWKLTAVTVSPALNGVTDVYANTPCYQDNSISFSGNGTFLQNEGSNVCSPYAQTETGTWSFTHSEKVLQTDYSNDNLDASYDLLELTETTLKVSGIFDVEGEDYTVTFTFSAQ